MIAIDTNSLILLILGLMDENLLIKHKRANIFEPEDFYNLLEKIGSLDKLITVPNVWTEVDNLLNSFTSERKFE